MPTSQADQGGAHEAEGPAAGPDRQEPLDTAAALATAGQAVETAPELEVVFGSVAASVLGAALELAGRTDRSGVGCTPEVVLAMAPKVMPVPAEVLVCASAHTAVPGEGLAPDSVLGLRSVPGSGLAH